MWNYEPPPGFHISTCFHWFLLPYIDNVFMSMGSFAGRVAQELGVPIGSVILPTIHVSCFKRSNGKTIISTSHLFSSHGVSHLKNLGAWRSHFMVELFDGVAWAILGAHVIQPKDKNNPILTINGERNNLNGKI